MKNFLKKQVYGFKPIGYLVFGLLLIIGGTAVAADDAGLTKGDLTVDGLTVMKSSRMTEIQTKNGVDWSEYTKYQITPVEVSFKRNWKRDYNRDQRVLSAKVTDKDMARIKETTAKIVYEEFDSALQKKGGFSSRKKAIPTRAVSRFRILPFSWIFRAC